MSHRFLHANFRIGGNALFNLLHSQPSVSSSRHLHTLLRRIPNVAPSIGAPMATTVAAFMTSPSASSSLSAPLFAATASAFRPTTSLSFSLSSSALLNSIAPPPMNNNNDLQQSNNSSNDSNNNSSTASSSTVSPSPPTGVLSSLDDLLSSGDDEDPSIIRGRHSTL